MFSDDAIKLRITDFDPDDREFVDIDSNTRLQRFVWNGYLTNTGDILNVS